MRRSAAVAYTTSLAPRALGRSGVRRISSAIRKTCARSRLPHTAFARANAPWRRVSAESHFARAASSSSVSPRSIRETHFVASTSIASAVSRIARTRLSLFHRYRAIVLIRAVFPGELLQYHPKPASHMVFDDVFTNPQPVRNNLLRKIINFPHNKYCTSRFAQAGNRPIQSVQFLTSREDSLGGETLLGLGDRFDIERRSAARGTAEVFRNQALDYLIEIRPGIADARYVGKARQYRVSLLNNVVDLEIARQEASEPTTHLRFQRDDMTCDPLAPLCQLLRH